MFLERLLGRSRGYVNCVLERRRHRVRFKGLGEKTNPGARVIENEGLR